jgi:DNA repair protein SbcC/Rad50
VTKGDEDVTREIAIRDGKVSGASVLTPAECRFYVERCYLAQSTLGKLLDIYQNKDATSSDSPLTLFVKELLGLDQLEDLIEGLRDVGDVRRLKGGAPNFTFAREQLPELQQDQEKLEKERTVLSSEVDILKNSIRERLPALGISTSIDLEDRATDPFAAGSEDEQLRGVVRLRREINVALEQATSLESTAVREQREAAESSLRIASSAVSLWRSTYLVKFEALFGELSKFFSNLPTVTGTSPRHAIGVAVKVVADESKRLAAILEQDEKNNKTLNSLSSNIAAHEARIAQLDQQISELSSHAGSLARALSEILPHVHTDDCPVCSRNFGEVSKSPLSGHVAQRISSLTLSASRLEALSRERTETSNSLGTGVRAKNELASRVLADVTLNELKTRASQMSEFAQALRALEGAAAEGEDAMKAESDVSAKLNEIQARDVQIGSLRGSIGLFSLQLGQSPVDQSESPSSALQRFLIHVQTIEKELLTKENARELLRKHRERLLELLDKKASLGERIREASIRSQALAGAKAISEIRIDQARELVRRAREERTVIVKRVFNDALNRLWSDLFVRLAPDEPFVPAFALPQSPAGAVEAVLETLYRSGGRGGNPQAMLSAGNLNTAALTLFLALHLSARPQLPLLALDDPVQSMDEVHIAQFAALLRTISKQHRRQILVAVHEKPLFDYLALELSPAFQSDRLVTVDIARDANGQTLANYEPISWIPDKAIAA